MGFLDRFKKKPAAAVDRGLHDSEFAAVDTQPSLEEPETLAAAAEQAQRAKFRAREKVADTAFMPEGDGVPSLNRRKGGNKLVNVGAAIAVLVVAGVLIKTVNGSKADKPKIAKDAKTETVGNLPPLVMPPAPAPISTDADATAQKASWVGSGASAPMGGPNAGAGTGGAIPVRSGGPGGTGSAGGQVAKAPMDWSERKMTGSLIVSESAGSATGSSTGQAGGAGQNQGTLEERATRIAALYQQQGGATAGGMGAGAGASSEGQSALAAHLQPTTLKAVSASLLPDRSFLLTKGKSIDCALETAIDTTLPGLITCVVTRDVWSDNGTVVLLERGSKMVGEQQGNVKQGQARVFALWDRAETPNGVVINLDSPGTDALGRSGLEGWVDNHFAQRFGAAILMTFINAEMSAYIARNTPSSGGTSVYGNTGDAGAKVVEKILDSTVNIAPNIVKNQGDHIQVMVARDLDFSGVYGLQVKR